MAREPWWTVEGWVLAIEEQNKKDVHPNHMDIYKESHNAKYVSEWRRERERACERERVCERAVVKVVQRVDGCDADGDGDG